MERQTASGRGLEQARGNGGGRRLWHWLLAGTVLALQVGSCADWNRLMVHQGVPFVVVREKPVEAVRLVPLTAAAERALAGLQSPLTLWAIDGRPLATPVQLRRTGIGRPGLSQGPLPPGFSVSPRSRLTVRDPRGRERVLAVPAARAEPAVAVHALAGFLLLHVLGWFYLAIGVIVWWRRPQDPSAPALLALCACAAVSIGAPLIQDDLAHLIDPLRLIILPIWASSATRLALRFTGLAGHPRLRRGTRLTSGLGLVLALFLAGAWFTRADAGLLVLRVALVLTGVYALWALLLAGLIAWRGARGATSLALRRRSRLLAVALIAGFGWPSMSLVLGPLGLDGGAWAYRLNSFFFALFPLLIGYAILRHRLFDLRIVLRRGLVYGVLTLAVSMAYLLLVSLVAGVVRKNPSPGLLALSVAAAVLLFGLLQVRVQRAVERFVHRRRYVYADALAAASNALSHDRTPEAIHETVRVALIDALGLERAYFAIWTDRRERRELQCIPLAPAPPSGEAKDCDACLQSAETSATPLPLLPLPALLDPRVAPPVARALSLGALVTTYDSTALVELTRVEASDALDPAGEAGFWLRHGLECVVPLSLGGEASSGKVVGLLLLGPKRDGSRLDEVDLALLSTLANQLSLAIEGTNAFAEVQRLNAGLEQEVAERTAELERALGELKQMQGQLVEAETQAMLGRVVAGIVHEVNTPLGGLSSGTDTMQRIYDRVRPLVAARCEADAQDAEARRALKALDKGRELAALLRRSSQRIGDVLGSLRRFVSLDEAEVKPLELQRSLSDVLTLLSPRLPAGVHVETSYPERPAVVRCQPARLNRAFLNVLDNAMAAIDGDGRIDVALRHAEAGWLEVEIADSGRGIPLTQKGRLFEVELGPKTDGRVGLRLGLPSAKRWVEELGGRLLVESEEGVGTRVLFRLPAVL